MVGRARGGGSGDGVNGAILATGVGNTGTVLEADLPEAGGCRADVRSAASGAGTVEPRAAWAEEGFTVVRRARRLPGAPPPLPPAPEDGTGGIAISRAADRRTEAGDGEPAQRAPGGSAAARRGAWSRSGFGAADHCRSGCQSSDVCFAEALVVLGGSVPWR